MIEQQQSPSVASNPFALINRGQAGAEAMVSRQAQEVQAAMVIAKKFKRDPFESFERIMQACKRKSLAEQASYVFPKGGKQITGPSIRLAETLAQNWGNIDFGIIELEQKPGESSVMAYAWDLETNTRQTKVFTVRHERHVGAGKAVKDVVHLSDTRDIYELVANQGARRLRSCILGVIPGDVIDAAIDECDRTLSSGAKEPLADRVRKMVSVFSEFGVTPAMIETRLGHKLEACIEQELVNLRKIFTSIKDGMAKRDDFFQVEPTAKVSQAANGAEDGDLGPVTSAPPAAATPNSPPQESPKTQRKPRAPKQPEPPALAEHPAPEAAPSPAPAEPKTKPEEPTPDFYDPDNPLGPYSDDQTQVLKRLDTAGLTVSNLLAWSTSMGITPEGCSDIREIDQNIIRTICAKWSSYLPQIKLASM